jgi:hypothetical protein
MNTASSVWYIRGEGNKPRGPFAPEQLIESWHTRRLDPSTLCWREGMAEWLPLAAVEPFASTVRAERRSARLRILRRVAAGLLIIVVLAAVAGIGYLWWTDSAMVARAEQLIAAERYEEASTLLEPLAKQSYFVRRHAGYLLALGLARQFASASKAENAGDDLLDDARKQFGELFAASPNWREQAKSDLAGIMGAVPSHVPGSLERGARLAEFLSAMQLADRKQLANELLSKAKGIWADPKCEPKQADGETVAWIVNGDAALLDDVVAAIVSDTSGVEANLDQRLTCILHCVRGQPALAPLFGSSLAKRADQLAATAALEKRRRLIATAKRIDSRFDIWAYWETYFLKADGENSRDAIEILTFMVEGEQDAKRLKHATELYNDLIKRNPGAEMTPPPEIRDVIEKAGFDKLIAEANELVKNRQYQDARTKLDDARRHSSSLWRRHADADRLDEDVRFHLDCEMARRSFGNGDLADALTKVQDALQLRPEDKEAADLRDKIQTEVDKAEAEQHRRKAESAIIAEDLRGAVEEIVKAREILERPGNATWGAAKRGVLDELAKTLIGKLHEQATGLSDKRQYRKAEAAVTLGRRLSPRDEQLSEVLVRIEALKSDPKSANISGKWVCQENGNVLEMTLTDSGADDVAWTLSEARGGGRQVTGAFTRTGAVLEGTRPFEMQGVYGQLTVKARIETPDTIVVQSSMFTPGKSKQAPRRDNTKHSWTRQATGETATPDETEEPRARSPSGRSSRYPGMRTDQNRPFGPRAPAPKRSY